MSDPQATDVETPADAAADSHVHRRERHRARPPSSDPEPPRPPRPPTRPTPSSPASRTTGPVDRATTRRASLTTPDGRPRRRRTRPTRRTRATRSRGSASSSVRARWLRTSSRPFSTSPTSTGTSTSTSTGTAPPSPSSTRTRVASRVASSGTDGKVLEALQELTRLAVQAETGERSRLMLDVAGHRAERRSALVELAQAAIAEVRDSGTKRSLDADDRLRAQGRARRGRGRRARLRVRGCRPAPSRRHPAGMRGAVSRETAPSSQAPPSDARP